MCECIVKIKQSREGVPKLLGEYRLPCRRLGELATSKIYYDRRAKFSVKYPGEYANLSPTLQLNITAGAGLIADIPHHACR